MKKFLVLYLVATATILLSPSANAGSKVEADECPRYSAEELKASVFDPVFKKDLTAMKKTFDLGVDGIAEIMEGLEGKKTTFKKEELESVGLSKFVTNCFYFLFAYDHRSQATLSSVSTWMGDCSSVA